MRPLFALVVLGSLPGFLAAQNFVTNGDFAAGLAPWVETGYSSTPGVEAFDVTGLGVSQCYGCGHGGLATPGPYPPNSIKQQIVALPGVPCEFTMDIVVHRPTTGGNADAGTFWVQLGGQEIARVAFGGYASAEFARARLTSRFTYTGPGGMQDLEVFMHRAYLGTTGTPRARVDNIGVWIATGPVFTWDGTRKLGTTRTIGAQGDANAAHLFLISLGRTNGITLPPLLGTIYMDLPSAVTMFSGVFNAQGVHTQPLTLPANPALSSLVVYVQGLQVVGSQFLLGTDQFLQFNP